MPRDVNSPSRGLLCVDIVNRLYEDDACDSAGFGSRCRKLAIYRRTDPGLHSDLATAMNATHDLKTRLDPDVDRSNLFLGVTRPFSNM